MSYHSENHISYPPLPSHVVTERPRNRCGGIKSNAVSPISTDELSPDDSGYLGQVSSHHIHMHDENHVKYPSQYSQDVVAVGRTTFNHHHRHRSPARVRKPTNKKKEHLPNNPLTWRMDPGESLSDFKLVVIGVSDRSAKNKRSLKLHQPNDNRRQKWNVDGLYLDMSGSEDERDVNDKCVVNREETKKPIYKYTVRKEYHLHKVNLAVGPRSCEYFTQLFQRHKRRRNEDDELSQHSIELPISCLNALPVFFDYIYALHAYNKVQATTKTAVAIRYLGTVFGNRSVFNWAADFIQNDLRPETAITYLLEAELYRQKKLRNVCLQICAEEFDHIKIPQLATIPPHLMVNILYSNHFICADDYLICSKIAAYCRCQENNIDGVMLLALTDASVMPEIFPTEALYFIKSMLSLGMNLNDYMGQNQDQCKVRELYERCISAAPSIVHEVLNSFCNADKNREVNLGDVRMSNVETRQIKTVCTDYRQLPPQVKVDLLEYALAKSQTSVEYGSI